MIKLSEKLSIKVVWFALITALIWMLSQKLIPFVVVDINRAVQEPSRMLAHTKLDKDAQLKAMRMYSSLLPKVIDEYGKKHRVTIIGASVLASHNEIDVTHKIISLTITRMKHEG